MMNELESQNCRDSDRVGDGEACKRSPFVARLAFTGVFVSFGPFQPPPEAARRLRSPKLMKPTPDFNLHTQMEALLMRSRESQGAKTPTRARTRTRSRGNESNFARRGVAVSGRQGIPGRVTSVLVAEP
ncbi:hypothetical protein V8C43DRAFT_210877 [Trichoderma afarasin]